MNGASQALNAMAPPEFVAVLARQSPVGCSSLSALESALSLGHWSRHQRPPEQRESIGAALPVRSTLGRAFPNLQTRAVIGNTQKKVSVSPASDCTCFNEFTNELIVVL